MEVSEDANTINYMVAKHTVKKMPKGKLICYGRRFLSKAKQNYAVIKKELLAVQWAVQKSQMYLVGAHFTIITDHQPLLGILNRKNIDLIHNLRIQRIMAKLIRYRLKLLQTQGKVTTSSDCVMGGKGGIRPPGISRHM